MRKIKRNSPPEEVISDKRKQARMECCRDLSAAKVCLCAHRFCGQALLTGCFRGTRMSRCRMGPVFLGIEGGSWAQLLVDWCLPRASCSRDSFLSSCILALPLLRIFTHLPRVILFGFFSGNFHHLASRQRELSFGPGPRRHAGHQRFRNRATMIMNGRSCPATRHPACRISDVEKMTFRCLG